MTHNELKHEMRKMNARDKERTEISSYNFITKVQNALRLFFSHEDGSIYIQCAGGVGYEDYLVEVSNPGNMAGHKADCLYADTKADFGMEKAKEHAKECQAASMYEDEEIEVVETDRVALKSLLKDLFSESEFNSMKEFVEHFMPENLEGYSLDIVELD